MKVSDYQNRTGNQKIFRQLRSQQITLRHTTSLGLGPTALYSQLLTPSNPYNLPEGVPAPTTQARGIVPSSLELGERPHFLDDCKDMHEEALSGG